MRNCQKVKDSSTEADRVRVALTDKLWKEKEFHELQVDQLFKYTIVEL